MGFSFFGGGTNFWSRDFFGGVVGNPPAIRSSPSLEILRIPLGPFLEGRLALNPGFFSLCSKAFHRLIFSVIFRASNHQLVDKKN